MLDLTPELERLRPTLGDRRTGELIARERREVFSVEPEIRIAAWGGAMLVATAAGIVLRNNLERIGPLALAALMAAAAAACYVWTWLRRARATAVDDAVLLLGALLLSGDVAFIESQFHLFGDAWYRHFLIVAVLHGAAAYAYRSRALLSLSITALAAWLGVRGLTVLPGAPDSQSGAVSPADWALRLFASAALVLTWRFVNHISNRHPAFTTVFDHFAANLALTGAIALTFAGDTRILGCFLAAVLAAAVIAYGFRTRRESFVLYGFAYGVLAVDVLVFELIGDDSVRLLFLIVSTIAAIAALFALHARFQETRS